MVMFAGCGQLFVEERGEDQQRERVQPGDGRGLVGGAPDPGNERRGAVPLESGFEQVGPQAVQGDVAAGLREAWGAGTEGVTRWAWSRLVEIE